MTRIAISILPVVVFLALLIYMDSFKLVKISQVAETIIAGIVAAIVSYFINSYLLNNYPIQANTYKMYFSPVVEESLKASFIIYLLAKGKVGFMIDAAIYGFAIGTGFALIENIYYLGALNEPNLIIWFIRGFGTAVMHGGTIAIFAIITKNIMDRKNEFKLYQIIPGFLFVILYNLFPGLVFAYGIHSFYNHFLLSPILLTLLQLIALPLIIALVFYRSENVLKEWMETGMDTDVELLEQINEGTVSNTHVGEYLTSLEKTFSGPVIADMLCYVKNHIELAIQAKGVLLMKQAGIPIVLDEETKEKLKEIKFLEKSIGPTGKLAISPILHQSTRDLWQIYMLEKN
ncbi:MAG TPA: PrsW family glutamic-type intramembrane protease [Ignavibacteriaceae bacterium]|nr:PrsW family glutamic-type intramembrane protease [Ignavibacteriaceae bacterium]